MLFPYKNAVYCRQTQQVSTPPSSPPTEWGVQDRVVPCLCRVHWIHMEVIQPLVPVEAVRWWALREVVSSIHPTRCCASINKYKRKVFSASTTYKIATENSSAIWCMIIFAVCLNLVYVKANISEWRKMRRFERFPCGRYMNNSSINCPVFLLLIYTVVEVFF